MKTKLTKDCFIGSEYYYRDSDIDLWLPKKQKIEDIGAARFHQLETPMTFLEAKEKFVVKDENCFTLPQIEECIKDPEKYGLRTDGWGNFFFVQNKEGSVSVVRVDWLVGGWCVRAYSVGHVSAWYADSRVFSRNSKSVKLESSDSLTLSDIVVEVKGKRYKLIEIK